MDEIQWKSQFREVYDRGMQAWLEGRRSPETMFSDEDQAFLLSIGCTAQELFDFVEDRQEDGEPDFETVLEVQSIRRDYFLKELNGIWPQDKADMNRLPPKSQKADGIAWLPRIIEKARLKLRGQMPADLMYGCGGDRPFLQSVHMTLPQFLALVRDAGPDDRRIIDTVKRHAQS